VKTANKLSKSCSDEGAARRGGTARRQEDLAFVLIDHHRVGGRERAAGDQRAKYVAACLNRK
jgi:hypothetical protein